MFFQAMFFYGRRIHEHGDILWIRFVNTSYSQRLHFVNTSYSQRLETFCEYVLWIRRIHILWIRRNTFCEYVVFTTSRTCDMETYSRTSPLISILCVFPGTYSRISRCSWIRDVREDVFTNIASQIIVQLQIFLMREYVYVHTSGVCVYVSMCTHLCTSMCTHLDICGVQFTSMCTHTSMCLRAHIRLCVYVHTSVHVYVHTSRHLWCAIYIHMHTYVYVSMCTHTSMCLCAHICARLCAHISSGVCDLRLCAHRHLWCAIYVYVYTYVHVHTSVVCNLVKGKQRIRPLRK